MSQGRGKATRPLPRNWPKIREAVFVRDNYQCQECKRAGAWEVDHIVPRSKGGSDDLDNLRAPCEPCHRTKTGEEGADASPRSGYGGARRRQRPREPHPGGWGIGDPQPEQPRPWEEK